MVKRKRKAPKRRRKRRRRRRFGMHLAIQYGPKVAEMLPLIAEQKYIGALKKMKPIEKGIGALTRQLDKIVALQNMPTIFTKFMNPLLLGLKIDLAGQEKFTQTEGKIKETKEALKKMGEDEVKLTAEYATAKSKIMMKVPPNKDIKEMQKIINLPPFVPVKTGLRKSLPSALLLFLIEDKETPKTNKVLAKFTVEKIKTAKKKVEAAVNKATGTTTPAATTTATTATEKSKDTTTTDTKKETTTGFGKRKRGPSASLKRMCKKNGVRLTVKRGKTRVYKSSKVLKEQCQNKLKKNFGRKKIKRYGIMPPKRKRRGKKRKTTSKKRKTTMRQRLSAAADYAMGHPGTIAGGLAGAGLSAAALNELQLAARRGYKARKNKKLLSIKPENMTEDQKKILEAYKAEQAALASPIYGGFTRGKKKAIFMRNVLVGFSMLSYEDKKKVLSKLTKEQIESIKTAAQEAYVEATYRGGTIRDTITGWFKKKDEEDELEYGKRRRRRRRKSKYDFGKKSKKPSAALRRMCKKLKVRMTLKRGKKRVYKSESMLKKQCKKAMKRRKKK